MLWKEIDCVTTAGDIVIINGLNYLSDDDSEKKAFHHNNALLTIGFEIIYKDEEWDLVIYKQKSKK